MTNPPNSPTSAALPPKRPALTVKEIQVEVARPAALGSETERINLMLTIVRGPRGRRKLLGEAFARQVYHPVIHFKVYDDGDLGALFTRFLGQLIYRGYRPLQYREMDMEDRWGAWADCDLSKLDLRDLNQAASSGLNIEEK
jgi:hypothetical protein